MKSTPFIFLSILLVFLVACNGNSGSGQQSQPLRPNPDTDFPDSIQRMQEMHFNDTLTWKSVFYHFDIHRTPDAQLPMVEDEHHIRYVDNHIALKISKGDANFFSKTFTKKDFQALLDNDFRTHGILEGLVFDCPTPEGLQFAASISDPSQDDWYMPFLVVISKDGKVSIKKDTTLDSGSMQMSDEDDGV